MAADMPDDLVKPLLSPAEPSQDALSGPSRRYFLFTRLADGVTVKNLLAYYLCAYASILSYTFVSAAQPFVLSALGIPPEEQGGATGDLGFYSELVIIALVTPWGILSDKIGRRFVFVAGLALMAAAFGAYPYAPSFGALVGFRLVYAVGAAATSSMLTSVLADTIFAADKGRAAGISGVFSGLGAVTAALLLLSIPSWVAGSSDGSDGASEDRGFRVMYGVTAAFVMTAALVALVTLRGRTSAQAANRTVLPLELFRDGFAAAWHDKRLGLAYCAGFVARGDAVVLTTFFALWIFDHVTGNGGSDEDATAASGLITGIAQTAAILFAPVSGYLASRADGVKTLLGMSAIALVGYSAMTFVVVPTSPAAIICACVVGVGEIGVIVASQSLATRHAPTRIRGAVGGAFGLCGSVGILVCSKLGGYLYDAWRPSAPFAVFAGFNFVVLVLSALLLAYESRHGGGPLVPPNDSDEEDVAAKDSVNFDSDAPATPSEKYAEP